MKKIHYLCRLIYLHRDFCPNESQSPLIDKIRKIRKNMKLKINDFGAIDQGTIDLSKRINLLCGPNGTGKTYLIAALFNELAKKDVRSAIIYVPEFLRVLKSSFGEDFEEKYLVGKEWE